MQNRDVYPTTQAVSTEPEQTPGAPVVQAADVPTTGLLVNSTSESSDSPYVPSNFTAPQLDVGREQSPSPAGYAVNAPQQVNELQNWFTQYKKNRPQSSSAGSASLIFISGGMHIAWGCLLTGTTPFTPDTHILICWYIGGIIGAVISAFITNRMTRKPLYLFSAFLIVVCGILFVALPHKYVAIVAARYLNGFTVGLTFVPMVLLTGEEVVSGERGRVSAQLEGMCFAVGIFLQISIVCLYSDSTPFSNHTFGATELHGILLILFGVIIFLMTLYWFIESPIYYLLRNDETEAINCLRQLQHPFVVTQETYQQLEEHKHYISANSTNIDLGFGALFKLCLYRGLGALIFSPISTVALSVSSLVYAGPTNWPLVTFGLLLWFGFLISSLIVDLVGRKMLMLVGALICGGMAIGLGAVYIDITNIIYTSKMAAALFMLFALTFFAGFYLSPSSAYLTEAFPLELKPYYIAIAFSVQLLVLLIITICTPNKESMGRYFITMGVGYVAFFIFGFICLPETKKHTLREAQDKFINFITHRS